MKRRFVALLAVPALALGFSVAPSNTDTASAIPPSFAWTIYCTVQTYNLLQAENARDWVTYNQIFAELESAGCVA